MALVNFGEFSVPAEDHASYVAREIEKRVKSSP